jgi:hypothetical protein
MMPDGMNSRVVNRPTLRAMMLTLLATPLLLIMGEPAAASQLGNLAASMKPGEWRQLPTNNIGAVNKALYSVGVGYDDNQHWNSKKRKLMIETAQHGAFVTCPGACPIPLITYDDETNTWTTGGARPPASVTWHNYDHAAWDDVNEVLYYRYSSSADIYRYCVNNTPSWCAGRQGTWTSIASSPEPLMPNCCQVAGAITYHDTLNGGTLLFYNGDTYGTLCGGLLGYRESTGTWQALGGSNCQFPAGDYHNLAEYSSRKQTAIFGGGNGNAPDANNKRLWKITGSGTITRLADAPHDIALGIHNRSAVADPVSGNFIFIFGTAPTQGQMWELNPDGNGRWTQIDSDLRSPGKICNQFFDPSAGCSGDFYGAAVSTYGVIMYWKYTGPSAGEVWIYKHAPSAPTIAPMAPSAVSVR